MSLENKIQLSSRLAQAGSRKDSLGAVSFPVYHATTFRHPALGESTGYDYTRSQNPTREVLESTLAELEGAAGAFVFSSGMSAVDTVLRHLQPGSKVAVGEDLYGGSFRLMDQVYKEKQNLEFSYFNVEQLAHLDLATGGFQALFVETPSNPGLNIADLKLIGEHCNKAGVLFVVDNTFMTPVLQRPLEFGADLVVYSGTKFLAGHNDALIGALVARSSKLVEEISFLQKTVGALPGPQDCWLLLRGLKTLDLRLQRQQENAEKLARSLQDHPAVAQVFYPGLEGHTGREIHQSQSGGNGAMVSFRLRNPLPEVLIQHLDVWIFAESLGGVESLVTVPAIQTHADMPEDLRRHLGIDRGLIRLSVGVEDIRDLTEDLLSALDQVLQAVAQNDGDRRG